MNTKLEVPSLGWFARLADVLMIPLMYLITGTFREKPQQTHRWNNRKLALSDVVSLDRSSMVHCCGVEWALDSRPGARIHLTILGGWKDYVVIEPMNGEEWHIGWIMKDVIGVSRIKLRGPVRVLLAPSEVSFFGVSAPDHEQIAIQQVGSGKIGCRGPFAHNPLL